MNERAGSIEVEASQPGAEGAAPVRAARRSNIEILIPTFNEEDNLPAALASVMEWADVVRVVDSESTDRTREIAEQYGAEVVIRPWLGYARQKNWSLENLGWESDWIFILDADEAIQPDLRDEMLAIAARDPKDVSQSGFYINRYYMFMGKRIRHCGYYPSWNLRFFKRGRARYEEREVHEHMIVDGPVGYLKGHMEHHDRRGLEHFIAKHNRYSTLEAHELFKGEKPEQNVRPEQLEFGIRARRWLKYHVLPRLPLLGLWRFIYMYFFRLGFLDGVAGFRFSLLLSMYDFFISLKLSELRHLRRGGGAAALAPPQRVHGLARDEGTLRPQAAERAPGYQTGDASRLALARSPGVDGEAAARTAPAEPVPLGKSAPAPAPPRRRRLRPAAKLASQDDRRPFTREDAKTSPHPPVSVIILCYNEEVNIKDCLESCAWCDDVHVLDSGSNDSTRAISERMGARVWVNPFKSFGQQRNWAIDNIEVKHRWQFQLDADERFTPALVREMAERIAGDKSSDGATAFQCPSMMMFMGRWLRHAAEYPVYQVRLIDKEQCRYEDYGHGQREVNRGMTSVLAMPYLHYNFSKGLEEWFEKHNRYSTLESSQALAEPPVRFRQLLAGLLSGDAVARRRHLKALSYRLPAKSVVVFLYIALLRLGFLDGSAGLNYARMRSIYEGMISVKMAVARREKKENSRA